MYMTKETARKWIAFRKWVRIIFGLVLIALGITLVHMIFAQGITPATLINVFAYMVAVCMFGITVRHHLR